MTTTASPLPALTLAPELRAAAPDLRLGCVSARVTVAEDSAGLGAALDAAGAEALGMLPAEGISALPPIRATRRAYKALGKDPARYRAASEALLRRLNQGKGLYRVNTVVDVNNLISLRSGLPIGTYDLDHVQGPVTFRRAGAGESYVGIGRGPLNLEGLPVFADDAGPFGSPTSDSERTMVRLETRRILMVLIAFDGHLGTAPEDTAEALRAHAAATDVTVEVVA